MSLVELWVPEGSNFSYPSDGSIEVEPPTGWEYVGLSVGGGSISASGTNAKSKISCTCNSGGGSCSPFAGDFGSGCLLGGSCTSCTAKVELINVGIEVQTGGYINTNIAPAVITKLNSVPALFEEMTTLPAVQALVNQFLNSVYPNGNIPDFILDLPKDSFTVPSGNSIALVNIAGRAVPLPVPSSLSYSGGNGKCTCTDGRCNLEEKGGWGLPKVLICRASACTGTCTLTVSDEMSYGQIQNVAMAQFYNY